MCFLGSTLACMHATHHSHFLLVPLTCHLRAPPAGDAMTKMEVTTSLALALTLALAFVFVLVLVLSLALAYVPRRLLAYIPRRLLHFVQRTCTSNQTQKEGRGVHLTRPRRRG